LVRFSDPTGVPTLRNADPNASPHGIAIRFTLADGAATDIVSISANGFPVATPEIFWRSCRRRRRAGLMHLNPLPSKSFWAPIGGGEIREYPKAGAGSFATLAFYGVNAFKFTNAKGVSPTPAYQIIPAAVNTRLSECGSSESRAELPDG